MTSASAGHGALRGAWHLRARRAIGGRPAVGELGDWLGSGAWPGMERVPVLLSRHVGAHGVLRAGERGRRRVRGAPVCTSAATCARGKA